jgi:hypothetical protein
MQPGHATESLTEFCDGPLEEATAAAATQWLVSPSPVDTSLCQQQQLCSDDGGTFGVQTPRNDLVE